MSRIYGFSLSCREVDFPRVRDFATAATREQSLKDLGNVGGVLRSPQVFGRRRNHGSDCGGIPGCGVLLSRE